MGALIFAVQWWRASNEFVIMPVPPVESSTTPSASTSTKPEDFVHVASPKSDDYVSSPLAVTGEARGTWYFEASFPIELLDADGNKIASGAARATSDWMTEDFVPFTATLVYDATPVGVGTLVLKKDNPSGDPARDAEVRVPVHFEPPSAAGGDNEKMPTCRPTGCSRQICSDKDISTTCEYRAEYACYQTAKCERQDTGQCGWTMTDALMNCLAAGGPKNVFPE